MSVQYKLVKIETNKPDVSIKLNDKEINVIYDCLNECYNDEISESASDIQNKLYELCKD